MAPTGTFPGVYVEEIPNAPHTISGVSTSVTAFIGSARRGPLHKARRINSFAEYEQIFGGLAAHSEMSYSVSQFFVNGGNEAWVVRARKSRSLSSEVQILSKDMAALDAVDPVNLLCLPGVGDPAALAAADSYCKTRRMFLIVDAPRSAKQPADMVSAISGAALPQTESGAIYYPWINLADPLAGGLPRLSAPCGTMAGVYARIDDNRGVWKAPAGQEATLAGVQSLDHAVTDSEDSTLSAVGVNSLRSFPQMGPVAWGARTLAGSDQANSEYKYIPVRRLALFIEDSIFRGTQSVVFEPNPDDEPLWVELRLEISRFLNTLFGAGAFQGVKPEQAYFVKCDRDTMTQADIDSGIINILVGFAPVKPAEFVLIRIQQMGQPMDPTP